MHRVRDEGRRVRLWDGIAGEGRAYLFIGQAGYGGNG